MMSQLECYDKTKRVQHELVLSHSYFVSPDSPTLEYFFFTFPERMDGWSHHRLRPL
eukprot:m.898463 g.898463  ORF g.898463 m.898463 type:complete len:56 (+) comp60025_c0_seq10:3681-3848(+)